jgi:hypothetical protein
MGGLHHAFIAMLPFGVDFDRLALPLQADAVDQLASPIICDLIDGYVLIAQAKGVDKHKARLDVQEQYICIQHIPSSRCFYIGLLTRLKV